jgi:hypothetical protein
MGAARPKRVKIGFWGGGGLFPTVGKPRNARRQVYPEPIRLTNKYEQKIARGRIEIGE